MEIEVFTHRIKTLAPRIFLMIDGPYIDGVSEEEKEKDRKVQEACDVFNATIAEIYGTPAEDSWAGKYYWPEWMTREDRLRFALSLEQFKSFLRHDAAQSYALHLDREKLKETKVEPDKTS
jgi:hypothetical protein